MGSGPLPLSSILLAQKYGYKIHNVDVNGDAIKLSSKLVEALGISDLLSFEQEDIRACTGHENFDVVFLAALVGMEPKEKSQLLKHIYETTNNKVKVVARSSSGYRRLLYPTIDTNELGKFQLVSEVHPKNEVINSILVLAK